MRPALIRERGRCRRSGVVALAAAAGLLGASTATLAQKELTPRIQTLLTNTKLNGAKVGVSVRDLDAGVDIADINADLPLMPASNMKLLTSGTALSILGPDFAFRTEFIISGEPGSERLFIKGSGDPALADPVILERMEKKLTVESMLEALAGAVKQAGITKLSEVVVDDRVFDRQWIHPTWPRDQLEKWYCAPVSGLNFHTNVISAFPAPSPEGVGRPPIIVLEPAASWLDIDNKAKTVDTGKNSVWLSRGPEGNRYTLFGEVRQPSRQPIEISLADVETFTGQVFAAELSRQGVTIGKGGREGAIQAVRLIEESDKYQGRTVAVVSTHMADILSRCNGDSHNLYAEALIKRVGNAVTGEPGSWTNGSSVVRMTIAQSNKLGPKFAAGTVIVDGSGLSHENRVSPATFTHWLDEMQKDKRIGAEFIDSLATPEKKGGIRRRFQDAKLNCELAAKTGTIDGVRCLSGYLTNPQNGHRISFSVMVNDVRENEIQDALQFQENVVVAIDRWMTSGEKKGAKNAAAGDR